MTDAFSVTTTQLQTLNQIASVRCRHRKNTWQAGIYEDVGRLNQYQRLARDHVY